MTFLPPISPENDILQNEDGIRTALANILSARIAPEKRDEEFAKIQKAAIGKLPIITLVNITNDAMYNFFSFLRIKWYLDDANTLGALWALENYSLMTKIQNIFESFSTNEKNDQITQPAYSKIVKEIEMLKVELAWFLFQISILQTENKIESQITDKEDNNLEDIQKFCQLKIQFLNLKERVSNCLHEVEAGSAQSKDKTKDEIYSTLKQLDKTIAKAEEFLNDRYTFRYFSELPMGILLKLKPDHDLFQMAQHVKLYSEMIHTGWQRGLKEKKVAIMPKRFHSPATALHIDPKDDSAMAKWKSELEQEINKTLKQAEYLSHISIKVHLSAFFKIFSLPDTDFPRAQDGMIETKYALYVVVRAATDLSRIKAIFDDCMQRKAEAEKQSTDDLKSRGDANIPAALSAATHEPAVLQNHFEEEDKKKITKLFHTAAFNGLLFPYFINEPELVNGTLNILENGIAIHKKVSKYLYGSLPSSASSKAIHHASKTSLFHFASIPMADILSMSGEQDPNELDPMVYLSDLRDKWCLASNEPPISLWAVDIYGHLSDVSKNTSISFIRQASRNYLEEFTRILFNCAFMQTEKEVDSLTMDSTTVLFLTALKANQIRTQVSELRIRINQCLITGMKAIKESEMNDELCAQESLTLNKLKHIHKALNIINVFLSNLYTYRYFHELRLEQLFPQSPQQIDLKKACEQLNTYLEMIDQQWARGRERGASPLIHHRYSMKFKAIPCDEPSLRQWAKEIFEGMGKIFDLINRLRSEKEVRFGGILETTGFISASFLLHKDDKVESRWLIYPIARTLSEMERLYAIFEETIKGLL